MAHRIALGALSPGHLDQANQRIANLSNRLGAVHAAIFEARRRGYRTGPVEAAAAKHAVLMTSFQALGNAVQGLDSPSFEGWVNQADNLDAQVVALEAEVQALVATEAPNRTLRIVGATVGSLALVGLLAWGIWYATQRGRS